MKHDWNKLKKEYMLGDYKNLKEFAVEKNIAYGFLRQKAIGWRKEKLTREEQKSNKIIDITTAREIDNEVSRNAKHLQIYDKLLDYLLELLKGYEHLEKKDIYTISKIAETLEKVQKGQNLAETLNVVKENNELNNLFKILRESANGE